MAFSDVDFPVPLAPTGRTRSLCVLSHFTFSHNNLGREAVVVLRNVADGSTETEEGVGILVRSECALVQDRELPGSAAGAAAESEAEQRPGRFRSEAAAHRIELYGRVLADVDLQGRADHEP